MKLLPPTPMVCPPLPSRFLPPEFLPLSSQPGAALLASSLWGVRDSTRHVESLTVAAVKGPSPRHVEVVSGRRWSETLSKYDEARLNSLSDGKQ